MERVIKFVIVAALIALGIGLAGGAWVGPAERGAVWQGVGIGLASQLLFFVLFFGVAFTGKPLLAHGLGMVGRLVTVGTVALFWVPWAGVPAAPLLFTLVAVLFLTTLVEPLFLTGLSNGR